MDQFAIFFVYFMSMKVRIARKLLNYFAMLLLFTCDKLERVSGGSFCVVCLSRINEDGSVEELSRSDSELWRIVEGSLLEIV